MKHFAALLLLFALTSYAQILNIPDPAFKAKLLAAAPGNGIAKNFNNNFMTIDVNQDGEIQQSEANQVYKLYVVNSTITSLEGIQNFHSLQWLECYNNAISTLDLTSMETLEWVDCSSNVLTYVHMPYTLSYLNCAFNQLTTLDVSNTHWITDLVCSFNPQLQSIFIKNGTYCAVTLVGDDNLQYICADPDEFYALNTNLANAGITGCEVNAYCSFTPGGSFGTLGGTVTFDADGNGCDATDPVQANVRLNITDFTTPFSTYTGFDGTYAFYGSPGYYSISAAVEHPDFFTVSPPSVTLPFIPSNTLNTQDFCISANGTHYDLETVIVPITPAMPGFSAKYLLTYRNKGNQVMSLTDGIAFTFDETRMDFLSANVAPSLQSAGTLFWSYDNLMPFETRSILLTMHINAPTDPNPVNLNDQLPFSASITPQDVDETADDNLFALNQTVVGSFDPNDITCLEGDNVSPAKIGDYLHYNINFENTGTAAAQNIVVKDVIDLTKFDMSSLQVLYASHTMTPRIANDKMEFIFENIQLGAGEHGNVTFKIKTKNTLVTGNSVAQNAGIYFDYNFPVITNTATTTFQTLGITDVNRRPLRIWPNPSKDIFHITSPSELSSLEVLDVQGRLLTRRTLNGTSASVDMNGFSKGVYVLRVMSAGGVQSQKVVLE